MTKVNESKLSSFISFVKENKSTIVTVALGALALLVGALGVAHVGKLGDLHRWNFTLLGIGCGLLSMMALQASGKHWKKVAAAMVILTIVAATMGGGNLGVHDFAVPIVVAGGSLFVGLIAWAIISRKKEEVRELQIQSESQNVVIESCKVEVENALYEELRKKEEVRELQIQNESQNIVIASGNVEVEDALYEELRNNPNEVNLNRIKEIVQYDDPREQTRSLVKCNLWKGFLAAGKPVEFYIPEHERPPQKLGLEPVMAGITIEINLDNLRTPPTSMNPKLYANRGKRDKGIPLFYTADPRIVPVNLILEKNL